MPQDLVAAIEAGEELRRDKELKLLPPLGELPVRKYFCYRAADETARRMYNEHVEELNNNNNPPGGTQNNLKGVTQGNTTVHSKGDTGAMDW